MAPLRVPSNASWGLVNGLGFDATVGEDEDAALFPPPAEVSMLAYFDIAAAALWAVDDEVAAVLLVESWLTTLSRSEFGLAFSTVSCRQRAIRLGQVLWPDDFWGHPRDSA